MTVSDQTSTTDDPDREDNVTERDDRSGYLPIPYRWLSVAFYLGILGWVSYLLFEAREWTDFEDWLIPSIAGSLLLVFVTAQLGRTILGSSTSADEEMDLESRMGIDETDEGAYDTVERDKRILILTGWIIALPVAIYLFGFLLVIPTYIFLFEWYLVRDLRMSALTTLIAVALLFVLFVVILNVGLWDGVVHIPIIDQFL